MGYMDNNLMFNSSLSCFVLSSFVKIYQEQTNFEDYPSLGKLFLVLPFVWHKTSRENISRRYLSTPFDVVIRDKPEILVGIVDRTLQYVPITCQGLNIACNTGLLDSIKKDNSEQYFKFIHSQWPRGSKVNNIPKNMEATSTRLSNWFKNYTDAELFTIVGIT